VDLARRLAQLDALLKSPAPPAPPAPTDPAAEAALCAALGLAPRETAAGPVWARDETLARAAPPPAASLAALADVLGVPGGAVAAEELLLLDTETTGLTGGTGTLAFLVGCAWWEDGTLRARQLFLPGPGREAPLLAAVADLATRFRAVATYNGARFDLPLLRTRALLARRGDPCAALAGWDLLRAARSLWGRRLPDCRQPTVEALACGLPREPGDVPGALAPQAWLRWLREGDGGELPGVLLHNRRDLRGMGAILAAAAARAEAVNAGPGPDSGHPWQDAWAAGRHQERRRRPAEAAAWMEAALAGLAQPAAAPEVFYADATRLFKRVARWRAAADTLGLALAAHGDRGWIHREAAILYEHRLRQLDQAWRHAVRLGDAARLARLERKRAAIAASRDDIQRLSR